MRSAAACVIVAVMAGAVVEVRSAPPDPAGRPWVDVDYGPFMSLTLEAPRPKGNLAYKGVVIPLLPDRSASMVFDTDLLRWSAGWGGGFIDWQNIQQGVALASCGFAFTANLGKAVSQGLDLEASDFIIA